MTAIQSKSPSDLEFAPRRPSFEFEQALATDWHSGSAFKTAYFNALSMLFPIGEKFFIDSVRYFNDQIEDPRLIVEVKAFQGQESVHRLEHQRYNETLCRLRGYDLGKIEKRLVDRLAWVRENLSASRQLAGTTAYEHLTAIMADDMLRRDDALRGADPAIAELWRWHGIEETEHKSVAFDVYLAIGGTTGERRMALVMNSWYFFKDVFGILGYMLKVDGRHKNILEWLSGLNFLFGYPGILRRLFFKYFRYFGKGFHPWDHDNRNLIKQWTNEQQRTAGAE